MSSRLDELDELCSNRHSDECKRTVANFALLPLETKCAFMYGCAEADAANVACCLLEAGLPPDTLITLSDVSGRAPALLWAAQYGSVRVVRALLDGGADHAVMSAEGAPPLFQAARAGSLECLQLLLAAGADPRQCDVVGNSPLTAACIFGRVDCARALLPLSDLGATSLEGATVLHACAMTSLECFRLLLPLVSDVELRTAKGVDPRTGAPNDCSGRTSLHLACEKGQQKIGKLLLKRGADRMARDDKQSVPLHLAAECGHLSCVVLLLERPTPMTPADVDAVDDLGWTSLHFAADRGHEKECGVLIAAGASLDARTAKGCLPLFLALLKHPGNATLHALLSGAGPINPPGTVCDHCGKTPAQASVHFLKACGNCHAARFCGADCAAAAWPGHKAACRARMAVVAALKEPVYLGALEQL